MHRLYQLSQHLPASPRQGQEAEGTLTVTDDRTGRKYVLAIDRNTIKATDLQQILARPSQRHPGGVLRSYDPGYMNTACCTSSICYIDGDKGILRYRGYPIEQVAQHLSFPEVSFLLIYGELPTATQLNEFETALRLQAKQTPAQIQSLIRSFRQDAHPMGILMAALAALGTFYPDANPAIVSQTLYKKQSLRSLQILRLLGQVPVIAAWICQHNHGLPLEAPREAMGYVENFLSMARTPTLAGISARPHPSLVQALEVLFVLHAEHELNCSTAAVRHLASSDADVYTAVAGAVGALYGPKHGGANEAVVKMLERIVKNGENGVPEFVQKVKEKREKLIGFGHRVYKNYDPRAKLIQAVAGDVFRVVGMQQPLLNVAMELEQYALQDEYFIKRRLYPNVDFYSGLIYQSLGFAKEYFPVLFAIPRVAGWLAHWNEAVVDPQTRIVRPFQIYSGPGQRDLVDIYLRTQRVDDNIITTPSQASDGLLTAGGDCDRI